MHPQVEREGETENHVQKRKTHGSCLATFDHSYSQARKQCSCIVLGSRFTTTNLEYTDTIYQIGRQWKVQFTTEQAAHTKLLAYNRWADFVFLVYTSEIFTHIVTEKNQNVLV